MPSWIWSRLSRFAGFIDSGSVPSKCSSAAPRLSRICCSGMESGLLSLPSMKGADLGPVLLSHPKALKRHCRYLTKRISLEPVGLGRSIIISSLLTLGLSLLLFLSWFGCIFRFLFLSLVLFGFGVCCFFWGGGGGEGMVWNGEQWVGGSGVCFLGLVFKLILSSGKVY